MAAYDISYTYDNAGNRLTKTDNLTSEVTTYAYDGANRLLTEENLSGITTFTYDGAGNLTERETPADTTYFTWDAKNHLAVVEPVTGKVTMTYDPDGRRVRKESPAETKKFVYDLERLLQETDDADNPQATYSHTLEDEYGDLVSQFDDSNSSYFEYDAHGNADALLDDAETVTDTYKYTAFGIENEHTGSSDNPHTFVGRKGYYRDEETEQYYVRKRYYDPSVGRWISEDPLGAQDDENLYRYVGNNPVNVVDPTGLQSPERRAESEQNQREPNSATLPDIGEIERWWDTLDWDVKLRYLVAMEVDTSDLSDVGQMAVHIFRGIVQLPENRWMQSHLILVRMYDELADRDPQLMEVWSDLGFIAKLTVATVFFRSGLDQGAQDAEQTTDAGLSLAEFIVSLRQQASHRYSSARWSSATAVDNLQPWKPTEESEFLTLINELVTDIYPPPPQIGGRSAPTDFELSMARAWETRRLIRWAFEPAQVDDRLAIQIRSRIYAMKGEAGMFGPGPQPPRQDVQAVLRAFEFIPAAGVMAGAINASIHFYHKEYVDGLISVVGPATETGAIFLFEVRITRLAGRGEVVETVGKLEDVNRIRLAEGADDAERILRSEGQDVVTRTLDDSAPGRNRVPPPPDPDFPPGSAGAARAWTIRLRFREANLPNRGRIRYRPPDGYNPANPFPRGPGNGYLDRFGNEWQWDPVKREWDIQLSHTGKAQLGWLSRSGEHINVSPRGEVTH